jgi:hypothetical protein
MKKMIFAVSCVALALAAITGTAAAQSADAPEAIVYDAQSALEAIKSFEGDWVREDAGTEHGANTPVASYKVTAAGSAIVLTSGADTPMEMATIFHMDGDQLLQTHYCALMNAPVLRFEPSDIPGELNFVFHGGTNLDAAVDAHYHKGSYWIKDKDTIDASFVVFANGEMSSDGRGIMKRAKTSSN